MRHVVKSFKKDIQKQFPKVPRSHTTVILAGIAGFHRRGATAVTVAALFPPAGALPLVFFVAAQGFKGLTALVGFTKAYYGLVLAI